MVVARHVTAFKCCDTVVSLCPASQPCQVSGRESRYTAYASNVGIIACITCIQDSALLPQVDGLAPSPRGGAACTVAGGHQLIVFGGADRSGNTFEDIWTLDIGAKWVHGSPSAIMDFERHACSSIQCIAHAPKAHLSRTTSQPRHRRQLRRWASNWQLDEDQHNPT